MKPAQLGTKMPTDHEPNARNALVVNSAAKKKVPAVHYVPKVDTNRIQHKHRAFIVRDQQQPSVRGQLGVPRTVAVVRLSALPLQITTSVVLATNVGMRRLVNTIVTANIMITVLLKELQRWYACLESVCSVTYQE